MARFRVSEPFGLASRNLFVLAGDVIDGHIAPGMKVEIPLNASTTLTAYPPWSTYAAHLHARKSGFASSVRTAMSSRLGRA
jgi:hypothetical protein